MEFPPLITGLPLADVPLPDVDAHMLQSERGLIVFFHFKKDTDLPEHSHGAQWGTVVDGMIELTISGVTRTFTPGGSYSIEAGEPHGAFIKGGTKLVEMFEDIDRFSPKA